jgi:4-amino-4-deoxy-L-arabinose transferase-like glycosyltransferase
MNNNHQKDPGQVWVYVTLAAFTLLVYILGLFPEATVDSAKYASVSREIYSSGDFIHLKIRGEPYLQKPPLLFWLAAIFFHLFGISIAVFKLPTLLFSFLGIYSTYRLGRLVRDRETGLIAVLVYGTSEALFLYNMDVHTDMLLTSNIIFAIWQLAEYLERRRALNFILGFAGIGLAMISKGMIGLAVPVFSVGGYLLTKKDFRILFSLRWLAGIPILLLILYPTLKGLFDQFGTEGLKFYFWSNQVNRLRGQYTHSTTDYSFFLHTLFYVFMPWSLYAYTAFVMDIRKWIRDRFNLGNARMAYAYVGLIIMAILISISDQQSPHYLLPVVPLISIIVARCLQEVSFSDRFPRTYKWMKAAGWITLVLIWPLIFLMTLYYFPTRNILIWIPLGIFIFLIIFSYLRMRSKIQQLVLPLLATILATAFVSNTVYMPRALKYHGPIQACYAFNREAADDAVLYTYKYEHFETYFYPKNVSNWVVKSQLSEVLSEGSSWFITSEEGYQEIRSLNDTIITQEQVFPYKKLTNVSFRFLNPNTREETLQNIYLLKIR